FNPNICHVCKSVNAETSSYILCDQCCLISYCNVEHKMAHYVEHKDICKIITQLSKVRPQEDDKRYKDWQEWIQSRRELIESIKHRLDRPIEPYEEQMFLWSKSCNVCHQQAELKTCQMCFSVNYCDQ
ncbi:hypothetical protein EAI_02357, partial [Harpegnathos saltator]